MRSGTGPLAMMTALALTVCVSTAGAQNIDFASVEMQTVKVADGLYVLMGGPAQGNIAVSVGSDGIFLVDSMYAPMHQKIMDALARISRQPVRYVVNTHLHGDHTAGNDAMAKLGAVIISHENMRTRMAAPQNNPPPAAALPVLTYRDSITAARQRRGDPDLSPRPGAHGRRFDHLLQARQRHARRRRAGVAALSEHRRR